MQLGSFTGCSGGKEVIKANVIGNPQRLFSTQRTPEDAQRTLKPTMRCFIFGIFVNAFVALVVKFNCFKQILIRCKEIR